MSSFEEQVDGRGYCGHEGCGLPIERAAGVWRHTTVPRQPHEAEPSYRTVIDNWPRMGDRERDDQ